METSMVDISFVQVLWGVFTLGVLYSFGRLGITQLKKKRPHVASMAASYTLLVAVCTMQGDPYQDWRIWVLLVALVLGVIGLIGYHAGEIDD